MAGNPDNINPRLTDDDTSSAESDPVVNYVEHRRTSPGFNRRTLCCCNDQVRIEGQGAIVLAAYMIRDGSILSVYVEEDILQRTLALDYSASAVIGEIRRRMYVSVLVDMRVSNKDLKADLGRVLSIRGWDNEDTDKTVNSKEDWDVAVAEGVKCDPSILRSIVMTLHYVQVTASWLNSRRDEADVVVAHPLTATMKEVGPIIEFKNTESIVYYVSRRAVYLANQIVEEEAASALYILLQGLTGPTTPFAANEAH